jgi:hypothetical protein
MARMMPAFCPQGAPPGERAVFAGLAEAEDTSEWIVLHSLALATHSRRVEGEADFVVLAPGLGILVIEVKSHLTIDRLPDGRWQLGSQSPTGRSPFQQAAEAMHSMRTYLEKKRSGQLRDIPVVSAVWFTGVRARAQLPATPEWHPWQVLDSEDLKHDSARVVDRTLRAGLEHLRRTMPSFAEEGCALDAEAAERIAGILRPKFEVAVVPADVRRQRESGMVELLEEQFLALDAMAENRAVLFTGPAGSGKTLLAMESARRQTLQGQTGRVFCYNRMLGQALATQAEPLPGLQAGTFHSELLRLANMQAPADASDDFWSRTLPEMALEALLTESHAPAQFLIIDEIQDLAKQPYLDVLDLLVEGGLQGGRLQLFGDFERQALFDDGDGRGLLQGSIPGLVSHRLTANCRNLPRIGHVVNTFSRLEPGYVKFRRQDDGSDPVFRRFARGEDQAALLTGAVRQLRDEGFDLTEIVVLSPLGEQSTAAVTSDPYLRGILRPVTSGAPTPGKLRYTTVASFKGLEAPAVVVTDLDRNHIPNFDATMYVALTRATDRLVALIETETLRAAIGGAA